MILYIASLLLGYLIGSFPTAYLVVKRRSRLDLRSSGSGNIGARNAFEVTGSRFVGALVLLFDLLKGIIAVGLSAALIGREFWIPALAGIGAVAGHNYPVWLRFHGGRGLATAAGVMLMFGWIVVAVWLILWAIVNSLTRYVHVANALATLLMFGVVLLLPVQMIQQFGVNPGRPADNIILLAIVVVMVLLTHIGPLMEIWRNRPAL